MGKRGKGEGSITRHKKSGLYMARYTVETPDGLRKRKTIYGKEREEVADKLWSRLLRTVIRASSSKATTRRSLRTWTAG